MTKNKTLRTCQNGHSYFKTSDCPICPICEVKRKPKDHFFELLAAPARRALENNGITTLQQLSSYTVEEIMEHHGIGKTTIPKLRVALTEAGLTFKNKS